MTPVASESFWIRRMRERLPPEKVALDAHNLLTKLSPGLASILPADETTSVRLYGVDSGFFYLPIALSEWAGGSNNYQQQELAISIAIGHAHFAIMDRVFDEH